MSRLTMLALGCCLLSACQPTGAASPPPSARQQPPAANPGIDSKPEKVAEAKTQTLPVTRVALGESIWLETTRSPESAALLSCADTLAGIGHLACAGAGWAEALPRQPAVTWQPRVAGPTLRVIVDAEIILRQGYLEHLLSRSEAGKDHESILSAPFDAERLYLGLVAAGLRPGKPATFINEKREYDFHPASGDPVKIYCQYQNSDGRPVTVAAQQWVVRGKEDKLLDADWVFAGSYRGVSKTLEGPEQAYFGANDGRVVCLTNFGSALLDLPFESVDSDPQGNDLGFRANTKAIPELHTKVRVIFQPRSAVKK